MQYIVNRLKEPSTYAGLAAILAAFGGSIDPGMLQAVVGLNLEADLLQAIAVFGAAAAGLVGIVLDEKSA